jgi:hypothetical protein
MTNIEITLPTLHADQVRAWDVVSKNDYTILRCGRRWGKTDFDKTVASDAAIKGDPVGWFAPEYKFIAEAYNELMDILDPVVTTSSKNEGVIRLKGGGRIDFWSLENERAGRSRKYKWAIIDEAAFCKPNMMDIWTRSIEPTLIDLGGKCLVSSNTNGIAEDNFLYQISPNGVDQPKPGSKSGCGGVYGFAEYHAPTMNNPLIPQLKRGESTADYQIRRDKVFEDLKAKKHPLVYQQEHLAEFVDWSGVAFFQADRLLLNGEPVPEPTTCDMVFSVTDTATKTGKQHDGTGTTWFAVISTTRAYKLVILDWDLQQIEGSLLEFHMPTVFQRTEYWAKRCNARVGAANFLEDKDAGMVLVQQAARRGWPCDAIDSKLTSIGKDERAISVSGYVWQGLVKFGREAYNKTSIYKEVTRNHQLTQVTGFRVGDKDAAKRADELLDTFCYGVSVALGDSEGV